MAARCASGSAPCSQPACAPSASGQTPAAGKGAGWTALLDPAHPAPLAKLPAGQHDMDINRPLQKSCVNTKGRKETRQENTVGQHCLVYVLWETCLHSSEIWISGCYANALDDSSDAGKSALGSLCVICVSSHTEREVDRLKKQTDRLRRWRDRLHSNAAVAQQQCHQKTSAMTTSHIHMSVMMLACHHKSVSA